MRQDEDVGRPVGAAELETVAATSDRKMACSEMAVKPAAKVPFDYKTSWPQCWRARDASRRAAHCPRRIPGLWRCSNCASTSTQPQLNLVRPEDGWQHGQEATRQRRRLQGGRQSCCRKKCWLASLDALPLAQPSAPQCLRDAGQAVQLRDGGEEEQVCGARVALLHRR